MMEQFGCEHAVGAPLRLGRGLGWSALGAKLSIAVSPTGPFSRAGWAQPISLAVRPSVAASLTATLIAIRPLPERAGGCVICRL